MTSVAEPGLAADFARQRWEWFGFADRIQTITSREFRERPAGEFALVASVDVLQCQEAPHRHAARYRELLRPGGHLFVTADFERGPEHPEHLLENESFHRLFGGEAKTARRSVLTNLGFQRNRWFWYVRNGLFSPLSRT